MPQEVREEIAEKVHNIMDILCDYPEGTIGYHCDRILLQLEALARAEAEEG